MAPGDATAHQCHSSRMKRIAFSNADAFGATSASSAIRSISRRMRSCASKSPRAPVPPSPRFDFAGKLAGDEIPSPSLTRDLHLIELVVAAERVEHLLLGGRLGPGQPVAVLFFGLKAPQHRRSGNAHGPGDGYPRRSAHGDPSLRTDNLDRLRPNRSALAIGEPPGVHPYGGSGSFVDGDHTLREPDNLSHAPLEVLGSDGDVALVGEEPIASVSIRESKSE